MNRLLRWMEANPVKTVLLMFVLLVFGAVVCATLMVHHA